MNDEEQQRLILTTLLQTIVQKTKRPLTLQELIETSTASSSPPLEVQAFQQGVDLLLKLHVLSTREPSSSPSQQLVWPTLKLRDIEEVVELSLKLSQVQKGLDECRPESELNEIEQRHITRLHDYNDIKDLGQMLMGRLAMLEGALVKDMYSRFGMELED